MKRCGRARRAILAGTLLAGAFIAAPARGDEASTRARPDAAAEERARALVETLRGAPADAEAERELYVLGGPALAPLAKALEKEDDLAAWERLRSAFEGILTGRLQELDERAMLLEAGAPKPPGEEPPPPKDGDEEPDGEEPPGGEEAEPAPGEALAIPAAQAAEVAAAVEPEVLRIGYAAARELARPGASRDEVAALARGVLLERLLGALRAELQAGAPDEALRALEPRFVRLGPLAAPLVEGLLRSDDDRDRRAGARLGEAMAKRWVDALLAGEGAARGVAREAVFGLSGLARPALEALVAKGDAAARFEADLLLQRIRWGISRELYERIGHLLLGFESLGWQERRMAVFELEKQGEIAAIPAIRRILEDDPSEAVRVMAAESLARLGDPMGARYLRSINRRPPLRLSPEVAAAIAMDQGIRYLQIHRYEKAIREFERVLEAQPGNDIALYNLACAYALKGEKARALDYLLEAIDAGFDDVAHMQRDPDLQSLHGERRFQEAVLKLGGTPEGSTPKAPEAPEGPPPSEDE